MCEEFARQLKLQLPLLVDPTNAVAARYDVRVTPFTFFIDSSGTILIRGVVNSWPQLEALIKEEGTFQGDRSWTPMNRHMNTPNDGEQMASPEASLVQVGMGDSAEVRLSQKGRA